MIRDVGLKNWQFSEKDVAFSTVFGSGYPAGMRRERREGGEKGGEKGGEREERGRRERGREERGRRDRGSFEGFEGSESFEGFEGCEGELVSFFFISSSHFTTLDPITKKWLKASVDPVFGYPSIIRFSWKTCTALLDANAVQVTWYVN